MKGTFLHISIVNLKSYIKVLSVEGSWPFKERLYTDNDFHPNLGFKFPTQTPVFTLNLVSRKGSLHMHWF